MSRHERRTRRTQEIGSKHQRKLRKYSDGFHEKFNFFLKSYREGLLSFCGSVVKIESENINFDARESFRMYNDGQFKFEIPKSKHPNILKAVIVGKKSWGLWLDQWTDGIVDHCFTKEDILEEFSKKGIIIPESFLNDFNNTLERKRNKRNLKYLEELNQNLK